LRPSTRYLLFTAANIVLLSLLMLHARAVRGSAYAAQLASAQVVKELRLTDLCLFTEARYTRHLSMADIHAPFQDHPLALEHFPSGSLVMPPAFLQRGHAASR
jgi:hypothetical protein